MLESLETVKIEDINSLMKEKPFYGEDIKQILDSLTLVADRLSDTMYLLPFMDSKVDMEKILTSRVGEVRESLSILERLRYSAHTGLSTVKDRYYLRVMPESGQGYLVKAYQFDGDFVNKDGKWYAPRWIQMEYILGKLYYSGPELYIYRERDKEHVDPLVPVGSYLVRRCDGNGELHVFTPETLEENFTEVEIGVGVGLVSSKAGEGL